MTDYQMVDTDDVPVSDLSDIAEVAPDLDTRAVDEALDTQNLRVKLWYFAPDEEIRYHAHAEQEELYYVLEGEFSLKLGRSGETDVVRVGPGAFWVAKPKVGHGHRYVGDDRGALLAIGAPAVQDPGLDPHQIDDEEIDQAVE